MNIPKEDEVIVHEAEYEESLTLQCPKCKKHKQINWGELEPGTLHKCTSCSYIWKIAEL